MGRSLHGADVLGPTACFGLFHLRSTILEDDA